jgi:hypothetical protein
MFSTKNQDSMFNPSVTERGSPRVTRNDIADTYRSQTGAHHDFPCNVGAVQDKNKKKFNIKF